VGLIISLRQSGQFSSALSGVAIEGGGRSRDCVVEDLRCRGNDEEDHHSRNLRRKIEVGRIRFSDDASSGRIFVRRRVIGDREREELLAASFGGASGAFDQCGYSRVYVVMRP